MIEINGTEARVIVDQMAAVDHAALLGDFAGRLSTGEMQAVDRAALVMLGLT